MRNIYFRIILRYIDLVPVKIKILFVYIHLMLRTHWCTVACKPFTNSKEQRFLKILLSTFTNYVLFFSWIINNNVIYDTQRDMSTNYNLITFVFKVATGS